jgi:hypothetical protein
MNERNIEAMTERVITSDTSQERVDETAKQRHEGEPVATLDDLEQEIYENTRQFVSRDVMEWMLKRYYTSPPQRQWVGINDSEIGHITKSFDARLSVRLGISRAIEAKLKEKNT